MPGACELAEWNVPHAPHEHRSLLVEIDEEAEKGLAEVGEFLMTVNDGGILS